MTVQSQIAAETPAELALAATASSELDANVDAEVLQSVPEQFAITDEQSANWLVKKIVAAREYAARVKVWAEQEQRRAQREEQSLMYLFGRQIEKWVRDEIAKLKGKRKSLALPAGTVGFRTLSSKLVVDDEAVVLKWAEDNCPNAIVVTRKLSKSSLDDFFRDTGEVPERGVHVDLGGERFFVR